MYNTAVTFLLYSELDAGLCVVRNLEHSDLQYKNDLQFLVLRE